MYQNQYEQKYLKENIIKKVYSEYYYMHLIS